jgi:hypothetical protein
MALDETSKEFLSLKKLQGKAHTSNDKGLANESLPSGLTVSAHTVFKDTISKAPTASLYTITDSSVEFLRLSASFIAGADTDTGRHGFELKLPDDYEANSSNSKAGTDPWVNGKTIHVTSGTIQLVPPSFATSYEAKVYHTGSGETRIPILDARDWSLDYFNGVFFQQDPPGTGDNSSNPRYVDCWVYVGDMLDGVGSGDITAVTAGTGLSGGALSGAAALAIDDGVVATLTGSVFSGAVTMQSDLTVSGTLNVYELKSILVSSSIMFKSGSNKFGDSADDLHQFSGSVHLRNDLTITGSTTLDGAVTFGSASVSFSGDSTFNKGISGSIQNTSSGLSYLVGGSNVTVTSASNGQITLSSADTNTTYTAGDGLDLGGTTFSLDLKSAGGLKIDSTELAIEPANFAGSGLEDDGSDNLRISAAAAGTGLNGGAGSALSVDNSVFASLSGSIFTGDVTHTGNLFVSGNVSGFTSTGSVFFESGLSGSLTHLTDGTSYLLAGAGITISTGSAGQITITNDGSVGDITSVAAGVGLSGGGTSGAVSLALDVSELSALGTTAETSDFVVIQDVTDDSTKKVLVSNLLASAGDITAVTAGTGLTGGGATGAVTLSVDDGIFAALSGSIFTGDVTHTGDIFLSGSVSGFTATGSVRFDSGLSGSLTHLTDGTSYLLAGTNVTVTTGSSGQITISSTDTNTTFTAGDGLDLGGTEFSLDLKSGGGLTIDSTELAIDSSVVPLLAGSTFTGDVTHTGDVFLSGSVSDFVATGSAKFEAGLSGSLTQLHDGSSYIKEGNGNITISTGSNGSITISTVDTNTVYTAGDGLDLASEVFSLDLKSLGGLKIDATELAVEPANFAGTGLEDDGSDNLRIAASAAGTGLKGGAGSALAIDDGVVATLSGSIFSGRVIMENDLVVSGTLTALEIHTMVVSSSIIHRSGSTKFGDTADDTHQFSGSLYLRNNLTITGSSTFNGLATFGSGSAIFNAGITGSMQKTAGGLSYVVAGDNVTVTSASNGQITIASSAAASTIGTAEDGDYTDGLYTDFTSSTAIGTAVDRFNEVLKALAPSPAPTLDDIDVNQDGTDASLSFGAANDQSSGSPAYATVSTTAGHAAVNVNGVYQTATTGNHLRAAIFDGTTDIVGDLNEDVPQNVNGSETNYPVNSFGDADDGVLRLEVNGSTIHEIDLTVGSVGAGDSGSGSDTEVNANGSGFTNLSAATNGTFENGNTFASFKHRTGRYKVDTDDQRRGWNYARVLHVRSGSTVTTNYIEWVNDDNADALAAAGNSATFTGIGNRTLSGVEYYVSGTVQYLTRVTNAYKYVYDTNNITFGASVGGSVNSSDSLSFSAQSKPSINTGAGENHTKTLHLTASSTLTADYAIGATATGNVSVSHPMKSNLSAGGSSTASNILMYNLPGNSTSLIENFQSEKYRLKSGSYGSQAHAALSGNEWDSTKHMSGSNTGHDDGLLFYIGKLYAPTRGGNSGNFQYANSPSPSNPDYSSVSGLRTFYRKFKNTTGRSVDNLSFATVGSAGTLVAEDTAVGSNNRCRIFFKHPGHTEWLDAFTAFSYHTVTNRAGGAAGASGAADTSLATATNYMSFGTGSIPNNELVIMKVEANAGWTGDLSRVTVSFGAEAARNVAPNLSQVDVDTAGTDASLSFGSSLALAGYTNVTNAAGFGAVDANGDYDATGNKIAVLNGSTDVSGDLNENVTSNGNNYVANSWGGGNAHLGSLKLEVNGSVIHTFNLDNSFAANSDTSGASGSGFNISAASVTRDTNQIPSWDHRYRTAEYTIKAADQRKGFNYARVIHSVTGSDSTSTYLEWVNDTDGVSAAVAMETPSIVNFRSNTTYSQSGIKYFITPKADFVVTGSNIYKYVYSENSTAISFPTSTNCSISAVHASGSGITNSSAASTTMALPNLDTSVASAYDHKIYITGTLSFDQASSVPGGTSYTMAASGRVHHPLKGNTTSSTVTSDTLLVFTSTDNSTKLSEQFNGEAKRLQSGSYVNQAAVVAGGSAWNSATSMNGGDAGHNTGLAIYNGTLVAPANTGNSGDFRSRGEGGTLASPEGNPNYTSVSNSTREYTRWFQNTSGGSKTDFVLSLSGSGTIVSPGVALGSSNKLEVHMKIPTTNAGFATGWMDIASAFETGKNSDDAGCLVGSLDSSLNSHITGTFGTKSVASNEYVLVRIVADKTWTGSISYMTLKWV